jgi:hypothetical protein
MSEQLKNKILNMEVAPPAAAWDFIAAELDKNATSGEAAIQYKMNQLEATPPTFIWSSIEKELDKNAEKVVPINRNKNFIFLRYAAAAVVIGLIGLLVFRYFNSNQTVKPSDNNSVALNNNNNPAIEQSINPITEPPAKTESATTTKDISSPTNTSNRLPLETQDEYTKDVYAFNEVDLKKAMGQTVTYRDLYNPLEEVRIKARDIHGNIPSGINAVTASNNYFITTGPNGEVVRVSNKLANVLQLFGDAASQEYLDIVVQEGAMWKQRFFNLRNKLNKVTASPDNFFDIVQLATALKEEKKP